MDKILLFAKKTNWCNRAVEYVNTLYKDNALVFQGDIGNPFPSKAGLWGGEIIISYLSPWIIPEEILHRASKATINFHPGSPEYPGAGCYNFALYEEAKEYGVTCHHMLKKVDTGQIIAIKKFSIDEAETVQSLKEKSMRHIWELFVETMNYLISNKDLPMSSLCWSRGPFRRKQIDDLCQITPQMDKKEIARRIRATYFPGAPGPYITLDGYKFEFSE